MNVVVKALPPDGKPSTAAQTGGKTMTMRATEFADVLQERGLTEIIERLRPYTMLPTESLIDLARQVEVALALDLPGDFVECGVWRGGASFLMAEVLRQAGVSDRKVWLFDSFEGLRPPEEIDGERALRYAKDTRAASYLDNCRASLDEVQKSMAQLGLTSYCHTVKGWFDQTLASHRETVGSIAVLRIDCDWYAPVLCCLETLYDQVVEGGTVILDDYYTYDGCALATHEFLNRRRLAHRIEGVLAGSGFEAFYACALFRKASSSWPAAWNWYRQIRLAKQCLAGVIPPDDTVIVVGLEKFGAQFRAGRRTIPFLERDGRYWGYPPDDETAIRELERLRDSGARFVVFTWPVFWWLDHYSGLREHLSSAYRKILENELLVIFDLGQHGGL